MMSDSRWNPRLAMAIGCAALCVRAGRVSAEEPSPQQPSDPANAGVCATDIRLQGTVYQPRKPERSMAMLRTPRSARSGVYVRGMGIEKYRVVTVEPRGVLLRDERAYCWLRLKPDAARRAPAAPPRPSRSRRRSSRSTPAFSAQELDRGVQKLGETKYRIDPRLLQQAFTRLPQLARATSFRTVQRDGRPYGLRVRRLAKDGLLARAGLRRGDVVRTLNGISLATPDGALRARTQLTEAKQLSLAVVRKGKPITLEYGLR